MSYSCTAYIIETSRHYNILSSAQSFQFVYVIELYNIQLWKVVLIATVWLLFTFGCRRRKCAARTLGFVLVDIPSVSDKPWRVYYAGTRCVNPTAMALKLIDTQRSLSCELYNNHFHSPRTMPVLWKLLIYVYIIILSYYYLSLIGSILLCSADMISVNAKCTSEA